MTPVTHIPNHDASQLPAIYFSRVPPDGGSAGGGKRPGGKKPAGKPKKKGGGKTSKKGK